MCKGLMIYFQLSTTFRYKSLKNSNFTDKDDILIFSREQLAEMGISDKEGLDMVMTHEAGHRVLQKINIGFNSYQEELCCDYLAGVRAGISGIDERKFEAALGHTHFSETHPDGVERVAAIEKGIAYAHSYMDLHDGEIPCLKDCLDNFENTRLFGNATSSMSSHDADELLDTSLHCIFVNDKAWNFKKADHYYSLEKRELHEADLDSAHGYFREAAEHARLAASYKRLADEYKHSASISTK